MIALTQKKIAAIKAVADDERGDPSTRAVARTKLKQYEKEYPDLFIVTHFRGDPRNPPNPRMGQTPEYAKWRFMDTEQWKTTSAGNHTIIVPLEFKSYRITVFRTKKKSIYGEPSWGWVRSGPIGAAKFSASRFETFREAQRDAWDSLTSL